MPSDRKTPAKGDEFTRTRWEWLERVQDDPRMSASHVALGVAIGRHLNRQTGEAWPRQSTLAEHMKVQARQVRNLLRQMEVAGHLEVVSGGFQKPDRYRPMGPADRQPIATLRPATHCHTEASPPAPERQSITAQSGNPLPPNPLTEPFEVEDSPSSPPNLFGEPNPQVGAKAPKAKSIRRREATAEELAMFEAWWLVYPRHEKRKDALDAFIRVLRSGAATFDELVAGAQAYAAFVAGKDPKFTALPTSWLNGARWQDERPPTFTPQFDRPAPPRSAMDWFTESLHDEFSGR